MKRHLKIHKTQFILDYFNYLTNVLINSIVKDHRYSQLLMNYLLFKNLMNSSKNLCLIEK
jgi:hypothetical protein